MSSYGKIAKPDTIVSSLSASPIPIGGDSTFYTMSFDVTHGTDFALKFLPASSGTVDITSINIEQGSEKPATEGAADTAWATPSGLSAIVTTVSAETTVIIAFAPVSFPYARFVIATGPTNDASTTIAMEVGKREEI